MQPETVTTADAAIFLGVKANTLEIWRSQKRGPKFVKIGRLVRYRRKDLDAFLDECLCEKTA